MINAQDEGAPALCCAAENEEDFMMWMTGLMGVMEREDEGDGGRGCDVGDDDGEG